MNSDPLPAPQPRVFHLDDGRLWRGGQHQVWLLMRELHKLGIVQRLLAREGVPLTSRTRELGIEVITLKGWGELNWRSPARIAALAQEFNANILHAHTAHSHAIALRTVRRLPATRLVTTRRVDFPVDKSFWSKRKYRAPGQHFIAISSGVERVLKTGGVSAERIDVVHSGVPALDPNQQYSRESVREELGIAPDELALLNVGALTDHKGQRWLIEAAPAVLARFPQARFHILGEGELRRPLQDQIERLGLKERIRLHGYVEDARFKMAGFDLFVSSSHLEGLGTAVLDAMLAELPVVAAEAGGIPDSVIDGKTGRLVPARDASALAAAIIDALAEPETSRQMAEAAREHVLNDFSARAMAEGTRRVYQKLLG